MARLSFGWCLLWVACLSLAVCGEESFGRRALKPALVLQRPLRHTSGSALLAEEIKTVPKARPTAIDLLLGTTEIFSAAVYKAALIEFVGMAVFTYLHIGIIRAAAGIAIGPQWIGGVITPGNGLLLSLLTSAVIAIGNGLLLTLLIFTCGPPSGGHLNPTITMATVMTGHTSVYRGVLYLIAQILGGIGGAKWMG